MKKLKLHLVLATLLGCTLFFMIHTIMNADVIMRQNCLEKATCYKSESLK